MTSAKYKVRQGGKRAICWTIICRDRWSERISFAWQLLFCWPKLRSINVVEAHAAMIYLWKFIDKIVDIWLKSCAHEDVNVAADILEGGEGVEVKYCRRCGAVRPAYHSEWRRPRPLWFPKGAQTQ